MIATTCATLTQATLLVAPSECLYQLPIRTPRMMSVRMSEGEAPATARVELVAQSRAAVGSLTPGGNEETQQNPQQYVGVPPPGSVDTAPQSFVSKARGPFIGLTLVASAAVAAWQSNRAYKSRQEGLLADFAATMLYHLGDDAMLLDTINDFRNQLGPGSFRGRMFVEFLVALATNAPLSSNTIKNLKKVVEVCDRRYANGPCCLGA